MHTARSLTISPSMLCSGGECLVPGGCLDLGRCLVQGQCLPGPRGCLPGPGGACLVHRMPAWSGGVPAWSGVWYPSMHCGQNSWHTLLKILPCPLAGGKYSKILHLELTRQERANHIHLHYEHLILTHYRGVILRLSWIQMDRNSVWTLLVNQG